MKTFQEWLIEVHPESVDEGFLSKTLGGLGMAAALATGSGMSAQGAEPVAKPAIAAEAGASFHDPFTNQWVTVKDSETFSWKDGVMAKVIPEKGNPNIIHVKFLVMDGSPVAQILEDNPSNMAQVFGGRIKASHMLVLQPPPGYMGMVKSVQFEGRTEKEVNGKPGKIYKFTSTSQKMTPKQAMMMQRQN